MSLNQQLQNTEGYFAVNIKVLIFKKSSKFIQKSRTRNLVCTNKSNKIMLCQHVIKTSQNMWQKCADVIVDRYSLSYKLTDFIQIHSTDISPTRKHHIPISFSADNKVFHHATTVFIRNYFINGRTSKISMSAKDNASWMWRQIILTLNSQQLHTFTHQSTFTAMI